MKNPNKVLLIDDDAITNYLHKRLIEKSGLSDQILIALNGLEALQLLSDYCANSNNCPELIFLDINMPVMNGFEFLEQYQNLNFANKPNVVLYVLTTSTNRFDMKEIKKYNVAGILNKPLSVEKLNNVILTNYGGDE